MTIANKTDTFDYFADQFANMQILRYRLEGLEAQPKRRKQLIYYLYQAALCGRDITWDQNYKHNLLVRHSLEQIVRHYGGDRDGSAFLRLLKYLKQIWVSNGIHHYYSHQKILPGFAFETLLELVEDSPGATFACRPGETPRALFERLKPILFDPALDGKKVNKDENADHARDSAVNFYDDISREEAQAFYARRNDSNDSEPVSHGLNSRLVRQNGQIVERVWKVGGLYSEALEQVVHWLEKAKNVAENPHQEKALGLLIDFYRGGDLKTFDAYCIAWVADTESAVDTINGFIETYNDPLDYRGTFEALVSFKDPEGTRRMQTIAEGAAWFEAHSPIMDGHRKAEVKGISGAVINMVVGAGDCSPTPPIGINLPNSDWIRQSHGSKSVNLTNVVEAYRQVKGKIIDEFAYSDTIARRLHEHMDLGDDLHTDLHEVIGHASGRLEPGVATPKETLRHYSSTLEEARADLVALYYLLDPELVRLGLMPSLDVGRGQYDYFILNGMMIQLHRLEPGENLEEDHMRNRQLIAKWAYALGQQDDVIERCEKDGKTFFVVNDYDRLRELFGTMLREVQRIKSQGDFEAGRKLVETYGVVVEPELCREVKARYSSLGLASYYAFLNPILEPVYEGDDLVDLRVTYADDLSRQMLDYSADYAFLPLEN